MGHKTVMTTFNMLQKGQAKIMLSTATLIKQFGIMYLLKMLNSFDHHIQSHNKVVFKSDVGCGVRGHQGTHMNTKRHTV